jgi:hypothetical protein
VHIKDHSYLPNSNYFAPLSELPSLAAMLPMRLFDLALTDNKYVDFEKSSDGLKDKCLKLFPRTLEP